MFWTPPPLIFNVLILHCVRTKKMVWNIYIIFYLFYLFIIIFWPHIILFFYLRVCRTHCSRCKTVLSFSMVLDRVVRSTDKRVWNQLRKLSLSYMHKDPYQGSILSWDIKASVPNENLIHVFHLFHWPFTTFEMSRNNKNIRPSRTSANLYVQ